MEKLEFITVTAIPPKENEHLYDLVVSIDNIASIQRVQSSTCPDRNLTNATMISFKHSVTLATHDRETHESNIDVFDYIIVQESYDRLKARISRGNIY